MTKKELLPILRDLRKRGWVVMKKATGGGHLRVVAPTGHALTISKTPSDFWAIKNIRGDIRRIERQEGGQ